MRRTSLDRLDSLSRYTVASQRAADQIIRSYSTSFGAATRLLGPRHRVHVRSVYALARIADELVDGASDLAGESVEEQHLALDQLEAETQHAIAVGYSSNPIVHAFAHTARASGIGSDLTTPFFAAMRTDLVGAAGSASSESARIRSFTFQEHATYVYGSAEVIGLMCLRIFIRDQHLDQATVVELERGARSLGAAFQNVNFLRDLADDTERLGRSYLSEAGRLSAEEHAQWVSAIREQLATANATLPLLPSDARLAVACALRLFARLTDRIDRMPLEQLYTRRVRVSAREKAWLMLTATLTTKRDRPATPQEVRA